MYKSFFCALQYLSCAREIKPITRKSKKLAAYSTYRLGIYPVLVVIGSLEIREVRQYLAIFIAVFFRFLLKHRRYKVGESQQLCNDSISAANQFQHRLSTSVVVRKEVHHLGFAVIVMWPGSVPWCFGRFEFEKMAAAGKERLVHCRSRLEVNVFI